MLQNGTSRVNKRTNKNVYCNTRGLGCVVTVVGGGGERRKQAVDGVDGVVLEEALGQRSRCLAEVVGHAEHRLVTTT